MSCGKFAAVATIALQILLFWERISEVVTSYRISYQDPGRFRNSQVAPLNLVTRSQMKLKVVSCWHLSLIDAMGPEHRLRVQLQMCFDGGQLLHRSVECTRCCKRAQPVGSITFDRLTSHI
jgi:hypothetical protein